MFEALDFAVESGKVLMLTGPNGSGKSSLIRIMAGLLAAVDGELAWNGDPVSGAPEDHNARLHYVGYQDAIKPVMTVRENLAFWAGLRGPLDRVDGALQAVGLDGIGEMPAQFLSSGQRRRLSLARIVASSAELWLLDEPAVGLDGDAIGILQTLIDAHCAAGGMAVLATHQPIAVKGAGRSLDISQFAARRQIFDEGGAGL